MPDAATSTAAQARAHPTGIDGRSRKGKRFTAHRAAALAKMGRTPSFLEDCYLDHVARLRTEMAAIDTTQPCHVTKLLDLGRSLAMIEATLFRREG